jgi:hypothetical protein
MGVEFLEKLLRRFTGKTNREQRNGFRIVDRGGIVHGAAAPSSLVR